MRLRRKEWAIESWATNMWTQGFVENGMQEDMDNMVEMEKMFEFGS